MEMTKGLAETAPDGFVANKDPVAMVETREDLDREKAIQIEKARKLLEKVKRCYHPEDSNHHEECRRLTEQFLNSTRSVGWVRDRRLSSLYGLGQETIEAE
ncbi:hypothetical protein AALP_AAs69884U000100 [Arabis alpina]|uniref:Uncharacterized protein n=1 Tax=Arabis alpina TaxID=50452 RepID=A0A087G3Z1_ARAAL|nr:hypothetical protein AALP_AAs69884U000100 [Arabis alpina]